MERCRKARRENQAKVDRLLESVASGEVTGPLLAMLSGKASELQREGERLKIEERGLERALLPVSTRLDVEMLRKTLGDFDALWEAATPEEVQRLVRVLVHRIEWQPDADKQTIEFYTSAQKQNQPSSRENGWLESDRLGSCPCRIRTSDPPINSRLLYR